MALDRQSIERKDFPVGRRGYDTQAVDEHLRAIAAEVAELERTAGTGGASLAAAASEQVRSIVDAAEATATQIRRDAEQDAKRMRADASSDAKAARERASADASGYVAKVSESAASMLERLESMNAQLGALSESLRTGATRLLADLEQLQHSLGQASGPVHGAAGEAEAEEQAVEDATGATVADAEDEDAAVALAREPDDAVADVDDDDAVLALAEDAASEAPEEPAPRISRRPVAAPAPPADDDADTESARLVALNMALNGASRGEVEHYLDENFDLPNRNALLDDVFASVER